MSFPAEGISILTGRETKVDKNLRAASYVQFALFQMIQRGAVVVSIESDDLGFVKNEIQEAIETGAFEHSDTVSLVLNSESLYVVSDKLETVALLVEAASHASDAIATLGGKVWANYGSFEGLKFGQELDDIDEVDEFVSEIWVCKQLKETDLVVD